MVWHHWPALHIWCLDIVGPAALEAHAHGAVTWPFAHMAIMCKCLCIMWWLFIGAIALADAADIESARTTLANFRIIAVLPSSVLRAPRRQLTQALSHTGSPCIPGTWLFAAKPHCYKPFGMRSVPPGPLGTLSLAALRKAAPRQPIAQPGSLSG